MEKVYAMQQFFIGRWEDFQVFTSEELARSKYKTFKAVHYRPTRLIERTETVLEEGKANAADR